MKDLKREFLEFKNEFEGLKADFLEKHAAFAKAVKQLKFENRKSTETKAHICTLRNQASASYELPSDFTIAP